MKLNSKISLDKSWKLTPRVLILVILGIIVILGTLVLVWPKEETPPEITLPSQGKTMEEILKTYSVPEGKEGTSEEVPPEIIEKFSAPSQKESAPPVPEEVIKNFSVPK